MLKKEHKYSICSRLQSQLSYQTIIYKWLFEKLFSSINYFKLQFFDPNHKKTCTNVLQHMFENHSEYSGYFWLTVAWVFLFLRGLCPHKPPLCLWRMPVVGVFTNHPMPVVGVFTNHPHPPVPANHIYALRIFAKHLTCLWLVFSPHHLYAYMLCELSPTTSTCPWLVFSPTTHARGWCFHQPPRWLELVFSPTTFWYNPKTFLFFVLKKNEKWNKIFYRNYIILEKTFVPRQIQTNYY